MRFPLPSPQRLSPTEHTQATAQAVTVAAAATTSDYTLSEESKVKNGFQNSLYCLLLQILDVMIILTQTRAWRCRCVCVCVCECECECEYECVCFGLSFVVDYSQISFFLFGSQIHNLQLCFSSLTVYDKHSRRPNVCTEYFPLSPLSPLTLSPSLISSLK